MPDYDKLHRLGSGAFGEVWLVFDNALGVQRAVKYVRPARVHDPTDFYREPKTLMALRHANIVRVEDAGQEADGTLYISMEYLQRGSLEHRFSGRPVPLSRALQLLCDVSWGLEFAHQNGYIHRDIKPANIMLGANGEGKLSDFGLATRALSGGSASPFGYLTHLAPEVFTDDYTSKLSDVYALGITAYRLVNGDAFLPSPADLGELQDLIESGDYPDRTRYRPYVPLSLKRVIKKALSILPDDRHPSAASFRQALEKIGISCDWKWKQKRNQVQYKAHLGDTRIRVLVTKHGRNFEIRTTKQKAGSAERRIVSDCHADLPTAKMKSTLRKLLSRFVTHGK